MNRITYTARMLPCGRFGIVVRHFEGRALVTEDLNTTPWPTLPAAVAEAHKAAQALAEREGITSIQEEPQPVPLASLKRGEYVRLVASDTAPVWVKGAYCRTAGTYELHRFDDINRTTFRLGAALVYAGFTF